MKLKLENTDLTTEVDSEIYPLLSQYKWFISPDGYARASIKGIRYFIHRFITGAKKGEIVDHIDRNKLNNKRENLRIVSHRENIANTEPKKNKISKYKGVSYNNTEKRRKKWIAACEYNGKRITIGRFFTEKEAALAYNKKAKELWGECAYQNEVY